MYVGDTKSNNDNHDTSDNDSNSNIITLDIGKNLREEQILTGFVVNSKTGCVIASLNHVYDEKTIVSNIYPRLDQNDRCIRY